MSSWPITYFPRLEKKPPNVLCFVLVLRARGRRGNARYRAHTRTTTQRPITTTCVFYIMYVVRGLILGARRFFFPGSFRFFFLYLFFCCVCEYIYIYIFSRRFEDDRESMRMKNKTRFLDALVVLFVLLLLLLFA